MRAASSRPRLATYAAAITALAVLAAGCSSDDPQDDNLTPAAPAASPAADPGDPATTTTTDPDDTLGTIPLGDRVQAPQIDPDTGEITYCDPTYQAQGWTDGPAEEAFGRDAVVAAYCQIMELGLKYQVTNLITTPLEKVRPVMFEFLREEFTPQGWQRFMKGVDRLPEQSRDVQAIIRYGGPDKPTAGNVAVNPPGGLKPSVMFHTVSAPRSGLVDLADDAGKGLSLQMTWQYVLLGVDGDGNEANLPTRLDIVYHLKPAERGRWAIHQWFGEFDIAVVEGPVKVGRAFEALDTN